MVDISQMIELEKAETEFFCTLLEFNNISDEKGVAGLISRAVPLARKIPAFSNWPEDRQQFWSAEAVCWNNRLDREIRRGIKKELVFLKGKNLDLGAGTHSYVHHSSVVDLSKEMLLLHNAREKIVADLENPLPIGDGQYDSITLVFVANYIKNIHQLLAEAKRVLKIGGKLVIVQSLAPVHGLHRKHFRNEYSDPELNVILAKQGMNAHSYKKTFANRDILFVIGERGIK